MECVKLQGVRIFQILETIRNQIKLCILLKIYLTLNKEISNKKRTEI